MKTHTQKTTHKNGKERNTQMNLKGICGTNVHVNNIGILHSSAMSERMWSSFDFQNSFDLSK